MKKFPRPVVVVSKCLGFVACRYDGAAISDALVARLREFVEFRPICPEVEIGLGVPREKIRIVRSGKKLRLIQPATGRDVTDEMMRFAESALNALPGVHGFILKSRSPSCGIHDAKIFSGSGDRFPVGKGSGVYAAAVLKRFTGLPVEDEHRLADFKISDHFLTRLFTIAAFEEMARLRSLKTLLQFHSENRLLLESHGRKHAAALDRTVANHERRPLDRVLPDYRLRLAEALSRPAKSSSNAKALMLAFDRLSNKLTRKEKASFLRSLDKYRAGKLPLNAPRGIARSWTIRFDERSLALQTFFEPYPAALTEAPLARR